MNMDEWKQTGFEFVGRYSWPMSNAPKIAAAAGVQKTPTPKLDLFVKRAFLSPGECARIIALIDAKRRPSTVSVDSGDSLFRTSETCDFDIGDPDIAALDRKIVELTGLDPLHGEPMQGQRYGIGQEFKAHTDYFEPHSEEYAQFCSETGQRTWTVMIYLNTPADGGATRFKTIGKIVQPETGKLLAWNNLTPDGNVNGNTLHQGMKVRGGVKYIVTKWFRERPWRWPGQA